MVSEQLALDGILPPERPRDERGRYLAATAPAAIPSSAEVATVEKAEFLAPLGISEYPNFSKIIQNRSEGQGIRFYDTMLGTDSDLSGLLEDLYDDVLHFERRIIPASDSPEHKEHQRLAIYAFKQIPQHQNVLRKMLESYARGFSVLEKIYTVVDRGEWAGAVIYHDILDKPQRWFTFDPQRRLRFRTSANYSPGVLVDQEKFLRVTFGTNSSPWGKPALDECYWPWFLKHHALKNQALWFEKWASPTPIAKYRWSGNEKTNREAINKALAALITLQNDNAAAVPEGIELKLLESLRNGSISFEAYISQLTDQQSRRLTGQVLVSAGGKGGSYAMGKVAETRINNKVDTLGDFLSAQATRKIIRDVIDRNYGVQDAYPTYMVMTKSPAEIQAQTEVEKAQMANGHKLSRSWSMQVQRIVPPEDPDDELMFPPGISPSQSLPINPSLAAPARRLELSSGLAAVQSYAKEQAKARAAHLEAIGKDAVKAARPAIRRIVKALGSRVRAQKKLSSVERAHLFKALKAAAGTRELGEALHRMLDRPAKASMASGDEPPDISLTAKLALALLLLAIVERIWTAAQDAPEGTTPADLADSISDPEGVGVDEVFGNLFEGTHSTNIASIATARLRRQLEDPKFRQRYPYVMIVVSPDARLSHRMMDGYILSAEDARFSSLLPPYDFGCRCLPIPISAELAVSRGVTGAKPAGTLEEFMRGKGAGPGETPWEFRAPDGQRFTAGTAPGFAPAYSETDVFVQLQALRMKAEQLRREDPEDWAALSLWLAWLFGLDVLLKDPPMEEEPPIDPVV